MKCWSPASRLHRHACAKTPARRGDKVMGIENLSLQPGKLKKDRLKQLPKKNFSFAKLDISNSFRAPEDLQAGEA